MFRFTIRAVLGLMAVIAASLSGGLQNHALSQTVEVTSSSLTVLTAAERERFLTAHNIARKTVGVEPVSWSDGLSRHAMESLRQQKVALIDRAKQSWAQGLAVLPEHSVEGKFGENVAGWVARRSQAAESAVELWLREKAAFDKLNVGAAYRVGDEEGKSETDDLGNERPIVVGHYTAIIWSATKHIGAAKLSFELTDDEGRSRSYAAIVCNYSPAGNRHGEKPY
jgi:pathogenesis-related protein 1